MTKQTSARALEGNGALLVREIALATRIQRGLENLYRLDRSAGVDEFVAHAGEGEREGELVIDYSKIPKQKPASWPAIKSNEGGLAGIVNGGMIDYLRGLSSHVSIGVAYKDGKHRNQWFALVRQDPG